MSFDDEKAHFSSKESFPLCGLNMATTSTVENRPIFGLWKIGHDENTM